MTCASMTSSCCCYWEREAELSDSNLGCCPGQGEWDKASNSSEVDAMANLADEEAWDKTELGLYKVNEYIDAWDTINGRLV